jgi:hypothetical protein
MIYRNGIRRRIIDTHHTELALSFA